MATFQRMIFKGDASSKIYPLYLLEDKKTDNNVCLCHSGFILFRIVFLEYQINFESHQTQNGLTKTFVKYFDLVFFIQCNFDDKHIISLRFLSF